MVIVTIDDYTISIFDDLVGYFIVTDNYSLMIDIISLPSIQVQMHRLASN